jgi:hypothetical protein
MTKETASPSAVDASRHICQEARVVLTSLRGGPPHVARGELAQDLMELRDHVQRDLDALILPDDETESLTVTAGSVTTRNGTTGSGTTGSGSTEE